MITTKGLTCRGFSLCAGEMGANDNFIHPNNQINAINQTVYLYQGNIIANSNNQTIELVSGQWTDVSSFANNPITYVAGVEGAKWLAINPFLKNKKYEINFLTSGNVDVVGSDKEISIICVYGNIVCNNTTLNALQYTRVLNNKTVALNIPEKSAAVIITA